MATKAFQKIYTKISQITKATCSLKATGVGYDELAMVNGKLAQVVKILSRWPKSCPAETLWNGVSIFTD